jgi:hypothetical protein
MSRTPSCFCVAARQFITGAGLDIGGTIRGLV